MTTIHFPIQPEPPPRHALATNYIARSPETALHLQPRRGLVQPPPLDHRTASAKELLVHCRQILRSILDAYEDDAALIAAASACIPEPPKKTESVRNISSVASSAPVQNLCRSRPPQQPVNLSAVIPALVNRVDDSSDCQPQEKGPSRHPRPVLPVVCRLETTSLPRDLDKTPVHSHHDSHEICSASRALDSRRYLGAPPTTPSDAVSYTHLTLPTTSRV